MKSLCEASICHQRQHVMRVRTPHAHTHTHTKLNDLLPFSKICCQQKWNPMREEGGWVRGGERGREEEREKKFSSHKKCKIWARCEWSMDALTQTPLDACSAASAWECAEDIASRTYQLRHIKYKYVRHVAQHSPPFSAECRNWYKFALHIRLLFISVCVRTRAYVECVGATPCTSEDNDEKLYLTGLGWQVHLDGWWNRNDCNWPNKCEWLASAAISRHGSATLTQQSFRLATNCGRQSLLPSTALPLSVSLPLPILPLFNQLPFDLFAVRARDVDLQPNDKKLSLLWWWADAMRSKQNF